MSDQNKQFTLPTPEQIIQQNKLFYAKQKLKGKTLFTNIQYSRQQIPDLVSKYDGYMQIYRRKLNKNEPVDSYYSSAFLNELKDKRNNMFCDEIIQKMIKQYELSEYSSNVDWRKIAGNGIDLSKTKFASNTVEIENYEVITKRMVNEK